MNSRKIIEIIIWIVSYLPVLIISLYRGWESQNLEIANQQINIIENININISYIAFMIIVLFSWLIYKVAYVIFFWNITKIRRKDRSNKYLKITSFRRLSLNDYSFFILSLMLPFIFEKIESPFDFLIMIFLIIVLIYIMVKMNQIMVNPVFLFSGLNIFQAKIIKGIEGDSIHCAIITKLSVQELESTVDFYYEEYFHNVYFISLRT